MDVAFVPVTGALAVPGFAPGSEFAPGAGEVGMASAVSQAGSPYRSPRTASGTTKLVCGDVPFAWCVPREVRGSSWGWEGFAGFHVPPLWGVPAVDFLNGEGQVVHALEALLLDGIILSPGGENGVSENAGGVRVKLWQAT